MSSGSLSLQLAGEAAAQNSGWAFWGSAVNAPLVGPGRKGKASASDLGLDLVREAVIGDWQPGE